MHDLSAFTPPEEASLRAKIARLVLEGEDVKRALLALIANETLQHWLIDLTKHEEQ